MELVGRARRGDDVALRELEECFDRSPAVWRLLGDIAKQAEGALIKLVSEEDALQAEALERMAAMMRTELAGEQPSPLEGLLAERVVACWLQVYCAERGYARGMQVGMSREAAEYFQLWQQRAHERYLSAIRTLAQVRRLLPTIVQVNIGAQQVNVGQTREGRG